MKLKNLFAHRRQSEPYFFAKIASARVLLGREPINGIPKIGRF